MTPRSAPLTGKPLNVLLWHVHGSWTTSFVQGRHRVILPVVQGRGPDGVGRARTWDWPENAVERTPAQLSHEPIDVIVLQRQREEALARAWLGGRRPGIDVPLIWLEHNAPQGPINEMRHPAADRGDVLVVHVTHTNDLFWDCGRTPRVVIEHGVIDPGLRYQGDVARAAVAINEAWRRGRVAGTDLLADLSEAIPLDLFGMAASDAARRISQTVPAGSPEPRIAGHDNLPQAVLHPELARRRLYLHPYRWTSLGLALIEAMLIGMPVVCLAVTEAAEVIPPAAGCVSNRPEVLKGAMRHLLHEPEAAREAGLVARSVARSRFALDRFLRDWDHTLQQVVAEHRTPLSRSRALAGSLSPERGR